jgi:hypothetical protein
LLEYAVNNWEAKCVCRQQINPPPCQVCLSPLDSRCLRKCPPSGLHTPPPPLVREDAPCGEVRAPRAYLRYLSLSLAIPSLYRRSCACLPELDRSSETGRSERALVLKQGAKEYCTRRIVPTSKCSSTIRCHNRECGVRSPLCCRTLVGPVSGWTRCLCDKQPTHTLNTNTRCRERAPVPAPGAVRPRPTLPPPPPARDYRFCCIHAGIFFPSSAPPPPPLALAASSRCCNHLDARTALDRSSFLINPLSRAPLPLPQSNACRATQEDIAVDRHVCSVCAVCAACSVCVCVCTWAFRPRWTESAPSPVAEFHTWQLLARRSSGLHHSRRPPGVTCAGGGESTEGEGGGGGG